MNEVIVMGIFIGINDWLGNRTFRKALVTSTFVHCLALGVMYGTYIKPRMRHATLMRQIEMLGVKLDEFEEGISLSNKMLERIIEYHENYGDIGKVSIPLDNIKDFTKLAGEILDYDNEGVAEGSTIDSILEHIQDLEKSDVLNENARVATTEISQYLRQKKGDLSFLDIDMRESPLYIKYSVEKRDIDFDKEDGILDSDSFFDFLNYIARSDRISLDKNTRQTLADIKNFAQYKIATKGMEKGNPGAVEAAKDYLPALAALFGGKTDGITVGNEKAENLAKLPFRVDKSLEKKIEAFKDEERGEYKTEEGYVIFTIGKKTSKIPKQYTLRESLYSEIVTIGKDLFYEFTGFPSFDLKANFEQAGLERKVVDNPFMFQPMEKGVFLIDPRTFEKIQNKSISNQPNEKIMQILDQIMPMSQLEQWSYFENNFLNKYDPDDPYLCELTDKLFENNINTTISILNNPVESSFARLEELYFIKPIMNSMVEYISDNLNTKTGIKMLEWYVAFLEWEKTAFASLTIAYDDSEKILNGEDLEQNLYQRKAKAYVVKDMLDQMIDDMMTRMNSTADNIFERYHQEELEILEQIISMGGKTGNEGLIQAGKIEWLFGNNDEAISNWSHVERPYHEPKWEKVLDIVDKYDGSEAMEINLNEAMIDASLRNVERMMQRALDYKKFEVRVEEFKRQIEVIK